MRDGASRPAGTHPRARGPRPEIMPARGLTPDGRTVPAVPVTPGARRRLAGDQLPPRLRTGAAVRAPVHPHRRSLAVQPANRPDQAGALAGRAARPDLAGPVGGQRRRRGGQPGLAGDGRILAPQHRLGQRQPQDRFHRPWPRGAPADLRRCHPAQPAVAADSGNPEKPRRRDGPLPRPAGFAALAALARTDPASAATKDLAARRVAAILAAKGGAISGITVGDCLELLDVLAAGGGNTSPYFYQLLHALGTFPPAAPPTVRAFKTPGQLTAEQLVDRYPIACQPVRALIIDYLRERQPAVDHATLRSLSRALAGLFWRDLELHHPGIGSLRLDPGVAAAWKQRVTVKTARTAGPDGQVTQTLVPRHDGMNTLAMVRAFYLDIAQWAAGRPGPLGPVGRALPDPRRGNVTQEGTLPPQVTDGPADQGTSARPARPGRRRQRCPEQDRRDPAGRAGHRPGTAVHRRRADAAPAGDDQARQQRKGVGRGPGHRQAPRPHPRRAPLVLDLGRRGGSSPHRHPHRGTRQNCRTTASCNTGCPQPAS